MPNPREVLTAIHHKSFRQLQGARIPFLLLDGAIFILLHRWEQILKAEDVDSRGTAASMFLLTSSSETERKQE